MPATQLHDNAEDQDSVGYQDAHTPNGECISVQDCLKRGTHTRPQPLPGNRRTPDGERFHWGPIVAVHEVGDYQIIEYLEDTSNFTSQPHIWERHGRTLFHIIVNGRSTNTSRTTLDSALVAAIAYKREGPNSQAATYFDRMTSGLPTA